MIAPLNKHLPPWQNLITFLTILLCVSISFLLIYFLAMFYIFSKNTIGCKCFCSPI